MNAKKIIDEFKFTANNLLTYNQFKLIQLLQKFNLLRILPDKYQDQTGPLAPYANTTIPLDWPTTFLCGITGPSGPTAPLNPTGPDKMYAGPTGPIAYHTIDNFINNIECYVNLSNQEELANMSFFTYECIHTNNHEANVIKTLNSADNYASSSTKTIKRKIHEYNTLIQHLQNQNADFKTKIFDTANKPTTTTKEINATIAKSVDEQLSKIKNPSQTTIDDITKIATTNAYDQFATTTTIKKIEAFSKDYYTNQDKITYLTKEKEKLQKMLNEYQPSKPPAPTNQTTLVNQNKNHIQNLKDILTKLHQINASQEQITAVQDKIQELMNKY